MVIVVPVAVTAVALTGAFGLAPSAFKWREAFTRFNAVSGTAGLPALFDTTRVPALMLTVLFPPPAVMFAATVPFVIFSEPLTSEALAPAFVCASVMFVLI